jgi:fermentation-respiration switch protein FrsA (DUF1100 family)
VAGAEPAAHERVLGAPASYYRDLARYDAPRTLAKLRLPALILQGERDYQVTATDFRAWQKALGTKKNASTKLYPGLNHLFSHGEGKSVPEEYQVPGHVEEAVVVDIAEFVSRRAD